MDPNEAERSDVVVILDGAWEGRTEEAVRLLADAGLRSAEVVSDEGAIEGTIDAAKIPDLNKLPCVGDVRTVFTYVSEDRGGGNKTAARAGPDPEADAEADSI